MGGDVTAPPRQRLSESTAPGHPGGVPGGLLKQPGRVEALWQEPGISERASGGFCSYLQEEVSSGRVIDVGDSKTAESLGVHCSPFGVIPKTGRPGRWRLIIDLSSLEQSSVNDGISKELSSLSYLSVDDVIAEEVRRGRGTLMAKVDIKKAYRNVPVHPVDRLLLGIQWHGRVYVDGCLPFGLRSASLLFTAVVDALQWVMEARGVDRQFYHGWGPTGRRVQDQLGDEGSVQGGGDGHRAGEGGRPHDGIDIPGYRAGLGGYGHPSASGKTTPTPGKPKELEGQEGLQEEGPTVNHWGNEPCVQGGQSGKVLPEAPHRPVYERQPPEQACKAQCGDPGRHRMVAPIGPGVEWG